jgi:hypothetical protein
LEIDAREQEALENSPVARLSRRWKHTFGNPEFFPATRLEAEKEELTQGMVPACETEHMDMPQTFLALPQQLQTLLSLQPPPIFSSVPCLSLSLSLSLQEKKTLIFTTRFFFKTQMLVSLSLSAGKENPNLHNAFLLQNAHACLSLSLSLSLSVQEKKTLIFTTLFFLKTHMLLFLFAGK